MVIMYLKLIMVLIREEIITKVEESPALLLTSPC
jgi:hypothetical protein